MRRMPVILVACTLLAACQSPGAGRLAAAPGEYRLQAGESLTLPDRSQLTYVRLVADSRCRPDVVCIRAGDADIEVRWTSPSGKPSLARLNSDPGNQQQAPNAAHFGPWAVALKALDWRNPPTATVSLTRSQ